MQEINKLTGRNYQLFDYCGAGHHPHGFRRRNRKGNRGLSDRKG